jgi:hypothetical protein
MQFIVRFMRTRALILASLLLLAATAYMYISYGSRVYFVAFHKPFHLAPTSSAPKYTPPVLPHFKVTSSIASKSLNPGDTQVITVTETPDRSVAGYLQVWVRSPGAVAGPSKCAISCYDKQVYKDDTDGKPTQFVKGKTATFSYSYTLPANLQPGTYTVSDLITSSDTFTDYYVNTKFAEFTVL